MRDEGSSYEIKPISNAPICEKSERGQTEVPMREIERQEKQDEKEM